MIPFIGWVVGGGVVVDGVIEIDAVVSSDEAPGFNIKIDIYSQTNFNVMLSRH